MPRPPDAAPDFDPEEREILRELQPAKCPDRRVLSAYSEGVLPEDLADRVGRHVATCAICTVFVSDLKGFEPSGPSPEQLRRIRSRIPAPRVKKSAVTWFAFGAAAAALAVLLFVFWLPRHKPEAPAVANTASAKQSNTIAFDPKITKAPIEIDADTALTWRGSRKAGTPPFNQWALALKPYKEDDFKGATAALNRIVERYPDFVDGYFYLGVSQLMLGQNQPAAVSLTRAEQLSKGEQAGSAAWYLGAAHLRLNQATEAASEWYKSCHTEGPYAQQACNALAQIKR